MSKSSSVSFIQDERLNDDHQAVQTARHLWSLDPLEHEPAIEVRGSFTRGRPSRIPGLRHERPLHSLSSPETLALTLAEFDPRVEAIFEQFELDVREMATINGQLGRKIHGVGRFTPSIDLLLRMKDDGLVAVECKRRLTDFYEAKTVRGMQAKRIFLEARGIELAYFSFEEFPKNTALNLLDLRNAACGDTDLDTLARWSGRLLRQHDVAADAPLKELIVATCGKSASVGASLRFKRAIWHRLIPVDLSVLLRFDQPLVLTADNTMGVILPW